MLGKSLVLAPKNKCPIWLCDLNMSVQNKKDVTLRAFYPTKKCIQFQVLNSKNDTLHKLKKYKLNRNNEDDGEGLKKTMGVLWGNLKFNKRKGTDFQEQETKQNEGQCKTAEFGQM